MDNRTTKETIRGNLLKYQGEKGLSVQEFADEIGVSRNSLGFWLRGERTPSAENLADIRKATGLSIDYLLGLAPSPASDPSIREICEYSGLPPESVEALHYIKNAPFNSPTYEVVAPALSFINRGLGHYYEMLKCVNPHLVEEYINRVEPVFSPLEAWITGTGDPEEIKIGEHTARKDDIFRELCFSRLKAILEDIAEQDGTFAETMKQTEALQEIEYERMENEPDDDEEESE